MCSLNTKLRMIFIVHCRLFLFGVYHLSRRVEVRARKFKVCCMTVKVIPMLASDFVVPYEDGMERS